MDERTRRRRSLWETEDRNLRNSWSVKEQYSTYDTGRSQKFSSSKIDNNSLMPKDQVYAGERMYKGGMDEPEMREQGLNKNYYKSMSPGYDGWDRRKRSDSHDDGLIHSHRYLEGKSRSRDRGRSRSHSPSWSRGRGRNRDGIRSRSRSRSRSRDRNKNRARDQTRSRSPFYDSRRESHGWNDRSGSGISSKICRDFAAGNCRRGSQCRFLHPDSMDGDSEDDLAERWRSRPERGHPQRYGEGAGIQSWDKVTDSSYSEDYSFRNKSKSTICCKNFIRGKCQWGASCRFSHDVDSGDNVARSIGNASFVHGRDHQLSEKGKLLCKYFLAGKCKRDNCRFSHDDLAAGNHERRPHDENAHNSLSVKNGGWNGPTWDQTRTDSDIAKGTGWIERVVSNQSTSNAVSSENMDKKWVPEGRTWESPEWKVKAAEKSSFISVREWNEDNDRDFGINKSVVPGNLHNRQEYALSQGLELANLNEISASSHAQVLREEDSSQHLPTETAHADISVKAGAQQHAMVVKDNLVKAFSNDGLGEVKELRSAMNAESIPRKSPNQNGVGNLDFNQSLASNDLRDNMFFLHTSNVQSFDLNGPGQILPSSLNMQNHHEIHQKEPAKTQEIQEFGAHQSFLSNASNGHVVETFPAHLHTKLNPFTATRVVPLQPAILIQPNPLGDGRGQNNDQSSGFQFEQKNQIPFEQFSPMSGDGIEPEATLPSGSSVEQFLDSPRSKLHETPGISEHKQKHETHAVSEPKEQETHAVLEVKHNNMNSAAECEKEREDVSKENVEGRAKVENGSSNKDDKDMRLFKNALVESVKEILKPTWKLGRMSREVHKTIVKKVVDKVTSTIQADHIPKTQDKVDQYLAHAKTKISKLVQAYVDRHLKTDS